MSSLSLKPGCILGPYPERATAHEQSAEALMRRLLGGRRTLLSSARSRSKRFVRQVDSHGHGLLMRSDEHLAEHVRILRASLHREGLTDDLSAESFAVIREMSYRTLGMRHYDSQILGGWAMLNGMLAEMETGEGKTLTATLAAATAALAGIPVHVITVNDYLVARDAALMAPVYESLGLTVGAVTEDLSDMDSRREAYSRDVTYCTNKQIAFDYLRDRLALGSGRGALQHRLERMRAGKRQALMLRGLCFAIVDEADSVLIDEARTPLILSGPTERQFDRQIYESALSLASRLDAAAGHFEVSSARGVARLSTKGRQLLETLVDGLPEFWRSARRREELVTNALVALHLRVRDRHYIVRDGCVQIIDDNTGRVMADRSWQSGIQQLVEIKEDCEISEQRDSLARITYQRFFRRYMRLGAMSGTAMEAANELASVYDLRVFTVPSHRPTQRRCLSRRIVRNTEEKWSAVLDRVKEMILLKRPVLIGTRTVEASETLSALLKSESIPHQVLNARQDADEARIVSRAGQPGQITIATNMAGRGTDIKIDSAVRNAGGLHIIATERNEAKRIDRQLFGRCGRQGDPGSFEEILAYDDDLLEICAPRPITRFLQSLHLEKYGFAQWIGTSFVRLVQANIERRHERHRHELLQADGAISDALAFTGPME